jgi:hypothetical protein
MTTTIIVCFLAGVVVGLFAQNLKQLVIGLAILSFVIIAMEIVK